MSVLVTGGAGYIGGHMTLGLLDAGESVVVLDNLSTGFDWAAPDEEVFRSSTSATAWRASRLAGRARVRRMSEAGAGGEPITIIRVGDAVLRTFGIVDLYVTAGQRDRGLAGRLLTEVTALARPGLTAMWICWATCSDRPGPAGNATDRCRVGVLRTGLCLRGTGRPLPWKGWHWA